MKVTPSLHSLPSSFAQVLCVGPTGTGKTLTTTDKLLKGMSPDYLSHFITFSARTSANQTQDIIDSKLDKRWGRVIHCTCSYAVLRVPEISCTYFLSDAYSACAILNTKKKTNG